MPSSHQILNVRTLCITDVGEFWVVLAVGQNSGVADTVLVYNAKDGSPVKSVAILQQLSARDSNFRGHQWVTGGTEYRAISSPADAALKEELDSIAPVPVADDWSDYRPARPEDFVGRDDLLKDIVRHIDDVRTKSSSTHLLAIKAPSGWGKSSFLVKLRSVCSQGRNKDRIFLYPVDCRTASSPRYPDLALKRCLDEAIASGFVSGSGEPIRIASASQPFSDETVKRLLRELADQRKVIVLFFDQFEEITTKQELSELFVQFKALCSAVEAADDNVVLGFSWKTDGTIPADHPAYHVWHSFKDRRKEFDLPLFSKWDVQKLLNGLARQLSTSVDPGLKRLLADHCQGYPWLLKKLCVHVFRVLQAKPSRQRELLDRVLDVERLFNGDVEELAAAERACLNKIAEESPADHFRVVEQFGDATVDALMRRRLIVRNSGKLVLYWDIFRDFVLHNQVPAIPARYLPVSTPRTAKLVIDACQRIRSVSRIASVLGLKPGTLDNIARDLVMLGVCSFERKDDRIRLIHPQIRESLVAAFRFLNSHVLMRLAVESLGKGFKAVPMHALRSLWHAEFADAGHSEKTEVMTTKRMVQWFQAFGIFSVDSADNVTHELEQTAPLDLSEVQAESRTRQRRRLFVGEAPPSRVFEVIERLRRRPAVVMPTDRNALYVLAALRVILSVKEPILVRSPAPGREAGWMASLLLVEPTIQLALRMLSEDGSTGAAEIGQALKAELGITHVSDASLRRYGSGILMWANWLEESGLVRFSHRDLPGSPITAV